LLAAVGFGIVMILLTFMAAELGGLLQVHMIAHKYILYRYIVITAAELGGLLQVDITHSYRFKHCDR